MEFKGGQMKAWIFAMFVVCGAGALPAEDGKSRKVEDKPEANGALVSLIRPDVLAKVGSVSAEYRVIQRLTDDYFALEPDSDRSFSEMTFDNDVAAKGKNWAYGCLQKKRSGGVVTDKRVA